MSTANNEHVQRQTRASRRALRKLRDKHPEEYQELYIVEAMAEGVMPRSERQRILDKANRQVDGQMELDLVGS